MSIDPKLLEERQLTPARYKAERMKRGTQTEVAEALGVLRVTVSKRETRGPVTREAWLALLALPERRKKGRQAA